MSTTTLKLSDQLKAHIARLAKAGGQSAHSFMVEALEHEVERAERMRMFVREAAAADADIEAGGKRIAPKTYTPGWIAWRKTPRLDARDLAANNLFTERAR